MTASVSEIFEFFSELEEQLPGLCKQAEVSEEFMWTMLKYRCDYHLNKLQETDD